MPINNIRIGVLNFEWREVGSGGSYKTIAPTTGKASITKVFSKQESTQCRLRITASGKELSSPGVGTTIEGFLHYPPNGQGKQEVAFIRKALVVRSRHKVASYESETLKLTIKFPEHEMKTVEDKVYYEIHG